MEKYLVLQIEHGKLEYKDVIERFPQYKEDIDHILKEDQMYSTVINR